MRASERLLKYVTIHTTSDGHSGQTPSTTGQFNLAEFLVDEMKKTGIEDAHCDGHCYVYGFLPATPGYEDRSVLGFIAHLDTSPDASGEGVRPVVHEDYDGSAISLGNGRVLSPDVFPGLLSLKGKTLITSDGSTLLGADDKAGIAEIMTMAEQLVTRGIPHGRIAIAFTPDEEIGHGAELLDLEKFGADYAYTVDGGAENEIEYENFNAAVVHVHINGISVHPGEAKGKMVNAALVACEFVSMLPAAETPSNTEGREGFFHLTDLRGDVESADVEFIIRDHSASFFEARTATVKMIEKVLNERYGDGTVTLSIREQYRNMLEKIQPVMHLVENARIAMREAGLTPQEPPVRGGTDGAQLSFRGLPCPNLGTGGHAFHGPYEHITAEGMDKAVEVLVGIVQQYANMKRQTIQQ